MATKTNESGKDQVGFMIGMVLFTVLIPALFFIAVALSPTQG